MSHKTVLAVEGVILHGAPAKRVRYQHVGYQSTAVYYNDCAACANAMENEETFFPNHFASTSCESERRNHCTCPVCWG